ncbi:hypothetical protein LTR78_005563 [Recurvomyces mirabilis]|uniref:Uncharacterized protein n=1 Tax=Recurvomyces mirabilis TaxID=574656 RepID=A0AAE0WMJ6_9PEZI|nr:hypothetical protein LTR78_005563 [Recurvomyces mirabilis]KAK5151317.1 hypothetical protein LTS14_009487 [Recurvomyces mirabilis]
MEDGSEPVFRSNKRRKVLRRRAEDDENLESISPEVNGDGELEGHHEPAQRVQKPLAKKHGIAFTSQSRPQSTEVESNDQIAIVAIHPSRDASVVPGANRFIKPTGKTEVTDDKHMTAFVDSKLAEMRSALSTNATDDEDNDVDSPAADEDGHLSGANPTQAPTSIVAQQRQRNGRRRKPRQPRPRDPNDIARASLIDDIMKESSSSHYDRAAPERTSQPKTDNEDTAAEAFKAQYLQDLAERHRRKPAAPPPFSKLAQAKANDRAAHGPKLGGSRSQRERMKAAQAEAGKEGVKK